MQKPPKMGEEETVPLRDEVVRQVERTKWFLWHGNVFQALKVLTSVLFDLEMAACERDEGKISKLCKAVQEFHTFIDRNRTFIPNYGERYRHGERISTGFVESTVNQVVSRRMVKKQQMRWSQRGATCCCRFAPVCSMATGRPSFAGGIRDSVRPRSPCSREPVCVAPLRPIRCARRPWCASLT